MRAHLRSTAAALGATLAVSFAGAATAAPASAATTLAAAIGGPRLAARGVVVNRAPGVPPLPPIPASGWLVADLDTGAVLAARDAHGAYAPASTLKVLTALVLIPRLDPAATITATSQEVAVDGTKVGVVPNHAYRVSMLLQGMLAVSGNDTARVLAGALGGDAAVEALMNARASQLQAYDTHAGSVTGLDAPGQQSSAYDLALLGRAGLQLPAFRRYVATTRATFVGEGVAPFAISNHNPLLGRYPGTYGVKNGYTNAARASYIGAAVRNGHHLIVTMIHADPAFRVPAQALLDWGFAADGKAAPVGTLVGPTDAAVTAGVRAAAGAAALSSPAARTAAFRPIPSGGGLSAVQYGGVGAAAALVVLAGGWQVRLRRRRSPRRKLRLPPI